jgi:hypothetical protein
VDLHAESGQGHQLVPACVTMISTAATSAHTTAEHNILPLQKPWTRLTSLPDDLDREWPRLLAATLNRNELRGHVEPTGQVALSGLSTKTNKRREAGEEQGLQSGEEEDDPAGIEPRRRAPGLAAGHARHRRVHDEPGTGRVAQVAGRPVHQELGPLATTTCTHEERMKPRSAPIQKVAPLDHVTDKGYSLT